MQPSLAMPSDCSHLSNCRNRFVYSRVVFGERPRRRSGLYVVAKNSASFMASPQSRSRIRAVLGSWVAAYLFRFCG